MLDGLARKVIDAPLQWLARPLVAIGCSASMVTSGGFLLGVAGCAAIAWGWFHLALLLIALNRLADGLDGAVARIAGSSPIGGYLDIVLDLIFYSGVPFAFCCYDPEYAWASALLIYSFIGTGGSFLAFAILAERQGLQTERSGRKSFFYSAGLMEGTETIGFFVAFCLWPEHYVVLAKIFAGLCWLTTLLRIVSSIRLLQSSGRSS